MNKLNKKVYVGKSADIEKRWRQHKTLPFTKSKGRDNCLKLYRAIRKYGIDNFDFSIVKECNTIEELDQEEIDTIEKLQTIKYGYNITPGGSGPFGIHHPFFGKHHSEESKKKSSISHTGKKLGPASAERKQKISRALKGKEKPHHKGEGNPASKLKAADIPIIKKLSSEGKSFVEIAKIFDVSNVSIKNVVVGNTWKNIK
jgi:group I intron endonuclease